MRVAFCLAAVLSLAAGLNFLTTDANAWCGWRCGGRVVVMPPSVAVAPVVVTPGPVVVSVPAPNPIPNRAPCGGGCGGYGYSYAPVVYGFYAATPMCYAGSSCYWRRDCWYDAFGRRFCN
jgi:hypothetical protein